MSDTIYRCKKEMYKEVAMEKWTTRLPMKDCIEKTDGSFVWLSFPVLENISGVRSAFSTRIGGVSKGDCSTVNFSYTRGDEPEYVRENYKRMAKALNVNKDSFVTGWQTHTTNIRKITEDDKGCGVYKDRTYKDVDGLMTNVVGITLVTFHADCIPLYLADKRNKAIALLHAGWRGTVNGIAKQAIIEMNKEYGTRPEDLVVAIGPGICSDCYEVSADVYESFRAAENGSLWKIEDMSEFFSDKYVGEDGKEHYRLDLKEANKNLMERNGVLSENISVAEVCTCCNGDLIFSHRYSGIKRGLNAAFLGLI